VRQLADRVLEEHKIGSSDAVTDWEQQAYFRLF